MSDLSFQVNPLDINIAKIQFNLIKKFEATNVEFPVKEEFESKDPTLNISNVIVTCEKISENNINLDMTVWDKNKEKEYKYTYKSGTQEQIDEAIKDKTFFMACKELVLKIDEAS